MRAVTHSDEIDRMTFAPTGRLPGVVLATHTRECEPGSCPRWCPETVEMFGRCDCCDGPDGRGIYHFANVHALRAFLAEPDHERGAECDIADIPGWPYGLTFVTTGEAEAWLDEWEAIEAYELLVDREMERRAEAAGVKL